MTPEDDEPSRPMMECEEQDRFERAQRRRALPPSPRPVTRVTISMSPRQAAAAISALRKADVPLSCLTDDEIDACAEVVDRIEKQIADDEKADEKLVARLERQGWPGSK